MQLKIAPKQAAIITVVIVFAGILAFAGYNYLNELSGGRLPSTEDEGTIIIIEDDEPGSMLLQFQMKDILNARALKDDADDADFWVAGEDGVFDLLDIYISAHDVAATTEVTDQYFKPGDLVLIHTYSDEDADQGSQGGTNYYDRWFLVDLNEDEKIYYFDWIDEDDDENYGDDQDDTYRFWNIVDEIVTGGDYTYKLKSDWKDRAQPTGHTVSITGGTTPYWDIGVLDLWPRLSSANLDTTVSYSGTILDKVTDGAANTAEGADGVGTVPTALTGKSNTIDILIAGGVPDCGFGYPMLYVKSSGELISREAYLITYFNQTTIGHDELVDGGWSKITGYTAAYASACYYIKLPADLPDKNDKMSIDIDLPIETTDCTASGGLAMIMSFADAQDVDSLNLGVFSTANPSFNGMSEWGLDTPLQATGPTVTSGEITQAFVFPAVENSA